MLFIILCSTFPLLAQEPVFVNFSEEEGLPGNDIYDVLSSDKGLIWFATDNGVSRFNGHEFVNFDVSDGLPSNSVIKLYEDVFGKIWFHGRGRAVATGGRGTGCGPESPAH